MYSSEICGMIKEYTLPIIVGELRESVRLARDIQKKYGVTSLICYTESGILSFAVRLLFGRYFYKRILSTTDRAMLEEILAVAYESEGMLLMLVPLGERYTSFVSENGASLGKDFILTTTDNISDFLSKTKRK